MKLSAVLLVLAVSAYVGAQELDIIPVVGGLSGSGTTTRYWDCCKPSCSWEGNLNGTGKTIPTRSCAADGETTIDPDTLSGCGDGGTSYMCTDQEPFVYNETITLGFVAASFTDGADYSQCCSCMLLSFSEQIANKKMVVQVTNTGSDLSRNHFDIAMPGGGVGIFNGCTKQWEAPTDGWGDRYGGVHSIEDCENLPEKLQEGCKWRFQWFEGADNPTVEFIQIECPQQLIDISGCI
ncbi:endoglucanase [Dendroctonus ponderosae]